MLHIFFVFSGSALFQVASSQVLRTERFHFNETPRQPKGASKNKIA